MPAQFRITGQPSPRDGQAVGEVAFFDADGNPVDIGGGDQVTWSSLPGKPAVIAAGSDQAAARNAIGAGTSSYTAPATATAAELEAGTVTAVRMVSPKLIHDEIARQVAEANAG